MVAQVVSCTLIELLDINFKTYTPMFLNDSLLVNSVLISSRWVLFHLWSYTQSKIIFIVICDQLLIVIFTLLILYSLWVVLGLIWMMMWLVLLIILREIIFLQCFCYFWLLKFSYLLLLIIIYNFIISLLLTVAKRLFLLLFLSLVLRLRWGWLKIILKFVVLSLIKVIILFWFSDSYFTDLLFILT